MDDPMQTWEENASKSLSLLFKKLPHPISTAATLRGIWTLSLFQNNRFSPFYRPDLLLSYVYAVRNYDKFSAIIGKLSDKIKYDN